MEEKKSKSRVCMTLSQSTGVWLNGCLQPQHYFVSLTILDPDGSPLAEVNLSFEQAARMLLYNGEVECTLGRYRNIEGKLVTEEVEPPKTVKERMDERLEEVQGSVEKRLIDVTKDIKEMINGHTKPNKTKLSEMLSQLETIKSHFKSNQRFVVQETEKELAEMQSNMIGQIGVFIQQQTGTDFSKADLSGLLPVSDKPLLIGEEISPIIERYNLKTRPPIPIEEMTAMEVGEEIQRIFYIIEKSTPVKEDGHNILYCARAMHTNQNKINLKYINYQGTSTITLEEAKDYLVFLKSIKKVSEFKHHWNYKKQDD